MHHHSSTGRNARQAGSVGLSGKRSSHAESATGWHGNISRWDELAAKSNGKTHNVRRAS
jgi:hypothetical protein